MGKLSVQDEADNSRQKRNTKDKKLNQGKVKMKGNSEYKPGLPRPPKRAAVSSTVPPGEDITYAQVMSMATSKISIQELGIEAIHPKRAMTGGIILEIAGKDGNQKAIALSNKLKKAMQGTTVRSNGSG